MAKPLAYGEFIAALKGAGLKVVEVKTNGRSPQYHNRNHIGAWGPVHGVMVHHTVTEGTDRTVEICRKGYSGLPGPLCHNVIAKDGTVYVVGYGRTNHAGKGDMDVLNAVRAESYATRPPVPNSNSVDGNPFYYGFECENLGDGKDPWPDKQMDALVKATGAICKAHGWSEKSVIGHIEWQDGKPDPRGFTMPSLRTLVRKWLAPKPNPAPKPTGTAYDSRQDERIEALEAEVQRLKK